MWVGWGECGWRRLIKLSWTRAPTATCATCEPPRLAVGLLTAPRKPEYLPVTVAKHIASNVDTNTTDLFVLQSFASSKNTHERQTFKELGFDVIVAEQEYPELLPSAKFRLTWVCLSITLLSCPYLDLLPFLCLVTFSSHHRLSLSSGPFTRSCDLAHA